MRHTAAMAVPNNDLDSEHEDYVRVRFELRQDDDGWPPLASEWSGIWTVRVIPSPKVPWPGAGRRCWMRSLGWVSRAKGCSYQAKFRRTATWHRVPTHPPWSANRAGRLSRPCPVIIPAPGLCLLALGDALLRMKQRALQLSARLTTTRAAGRRRFCPRNMQPP